MGKTPGVAFGNEDGVVAKTAFAGRCGQDMAVADAFELVFGAFPDEGDDGPETRLAIGCGGGVEFVQEFFDVVFERAMFSCIAGAVYPGFAIEGGDFEAGVFAKAVGPGEAVDS